MHLEQVPGRRWKPGAVIDCNVIYYKRSSPMLDRFMTAPSCRTSQTDDA